MRRVVLTILVVVLSLSAVLIAPAGTRFTHVSVAQDATPPAVTTACPAVVAGIDEYMDETTGAVRTELKKTPSADPADLYYLRQSTICFPPGTGSDSGPYLFTYYIFVQEGELTVTVTSLVDANSMVILYHNNVPTVAAAGDTITATVGDAIFMANVEVEITNASGNPTIIISSSVYKDPEPSCTTKCWIP